MIAPTCFGPPGPLSGSLRWTLLKLRIFIDYLHKIVTLARFGIGSLMMVQVDQNM